MNIRIRKLFDRYRVRISIGILFSVLMHALILSLQLGIPGLGLPGLGLPWDERRAQTPELSIHLANTAGSPNNDLQKTRAPAQNETMPKPLEALPGNDRTEELTKTHIRQTPLRPAANDLREARALRSTPAIAQTVQKKGTPPPEDQSPPVFARSQQELIALAGNRPDSFTVPAPDANDWRRPAPTTDMTPRPVQPLKQAAAPAVAMQSPRQSIDQMQEPIPAVQKPAEKESFESPEESKPKEPEPSQSAPVAMEKAMHERGEEIAEQDTARKPEEQETAQRDQDTTTREEDARKTEEAARQAAAQKREAEQTAYRAKEEADKKRQDAEKQALADAERQAQELAAQKQAEETARRQTEALALQKQAEAVRLEEIRQREQAKEEQEKERQAAELTAQKLAQEQEAARRKAVALERKKEAEQKAQEAQKAAARQQAEAATQRENARLAATASAAPGPGAASGQGAGNSPGPSKGANGTGNSPNGTRIGNLASRSLEQIGKIDLSRPAPALSAESAQPEEDTRPRSILGFYDHDVVVDAYIRSWRTKIERNGSLNYSQSSRDKARENPVVTVSIRSDGSVEDIVINRSSGRTDLDEAVKRIVRVNAPYSVFSTSLARKYPVIEIRRIWDFDDTLRILEEVR